jgi:hypothetical protein
MSSSTAKTIVLDGPFNWLPWINIIQSKAQRGEIDVWGYINPNLTTPLPIPAEPTYPTPRDADSKSDSILQLDAVGISKYRLLKEEHDYKNKKRTTILKTISQIDSYIMESITVKNELWTRNCKSTWEVLFNLKKRLSPTDQARKLEVIRAYSALKQYSKRISMETYLYEWERLYSLAIDLDLPDVKEERPLYDFAQAIQEVDESFSTNLQFRIEDNITARSINDATDSIPFLEVIESYRNHYRRQQAGKSKANLGTFASYQGKDQESPAPCLCESKHLHRNCYYLNPSTRPSNWTGKDATYHKINALLEDPKRSHLRTKVLETFRYDGLPKGKGNPNAKETPSNSKDTAQYPPLSGTMSKDSSEASSELLGTFTTTLTSLSISSELEYRLYDSWILDGGSDTHVYNSSILHSGSFSTTRQAQQGERLFAGKTSYAIAAFGTARISVNTPSSPKWIDLEDVALAPGFITSIVSLHRLNKGDLHWNSRTPNQLERLDGSVACYVNQEGGHLVLTGQQAYTAFATRQHARPSRDPKLPTFTEERLHKILGHANPEAIRHVFDAVQGINVDDTVPCPRSCNCSICALSKAKNIISRRPGSENQRSGKPFDCLCWDALVLDPAYNGDIYISHFYCPDTQFHLTFSCQSKKDFKDTLQTVLKLVQH